MSSLFSDIQSNIKQYLRDPVHHYLKGPGDMM